MSAGDWWTESWTPVVGCDMTLPCAAHCWARRWARRLARNSKTAAKYTGITDEQGQWTGVVRLDEKELLHPLHWMKPRVVAVSLMGDIFLAGDEVLDRLYAVMALCPQHRFVVLTKRGLHREKYLSGIMGDPMMRLAGDIADRAGEIAGLTLPLCRVCGGEGGAGEGYGPPCPKCDGTGIRGENPGAFARRIDPDNGGWPLPNVIEVVSVSTQAELDERWPWLAKTPAAKRGLHVEPLLGPLDIRRCLPQPPGESWAQEVMTAWGEDLRRVDWLVVGAETGPGARPMHPDWVRKIRDDCGAAQIPFWLKFCDTDSSGNRIRTIDGREYNGVPW